MTDVRIVPTHELSSAELRALRGLLDEAFDGGFTDDDWDHTVGGLHVVVLDGAIVSHGSVVERLLVAGDRPLRTGYVEGVATATGHRNRGHAQTVMRAVGGIIRSHHELGGLSTGLVDYYMRFGWEVWQGPTYVNAPDGPARTAEDDGGVMILRTRFTSDLDTTTRLMCDWRAGDVW